MIYALTHLSFRIEILYPDTCTDNGTHNPWNTGLELLSPNHMTNITGHGCS